MTTAYEYVERNKRKSRILVALFPVSFTLFAYLSVLGFYILWGLLVYYRPNNIWSFSSLWNHAFVSAHETCVWLLPLCFGLAVFWAWQAWKQGDQILLEAVGHIHPLEKWEHLEIYTLLENLCISSGDYMPQLYILDDESMNAFSIGMSPMRAGIVLSNGLIKRLNRMQLEGVLAHELAHIRHYDTRLMIIITTCLAFFTFAGEILFYGTEKDNIPESEMGPQQAVYWRRTRFPLFVYAGMMLMCYGYLIAPVLQFALSRTRESMADAQAVLLTRYPKGLASALWTVSQNSRIEALDEHTLLGTMCLARPRGKDTFFERISGIGRTHPPIEQRMRALREMDGGDGQFWSN